MAEKLKTYQEVRISKNAEFIVGIVVGFGLLSAITLPSISLGGVSVYFVTIVSPIILVISFWAWNQKPSVHVAAIYPFFLGCIVLLSSLYSWAVGYSSVNYRDLVESVKYYQFFPYLIIVFSLGQRSLSLFHFLLVSAAIWIGFVGFVQVFGTAHMLSLLYLGENSPHIQSVILGHRITLTGSDPNVGGVIACFFVIYFFSLFAVTSKYKNLVYASFFLFLCFMTQSRTSLVAVIFGLGSYYLFLYKSFFLTKWLFAAICISLVPFVVYYLDLSYIYIGFQYALEGTNNSINVRFENMLLAFQSFLSSPLFGIGPAKSSVSTIIDSEYALIVQRYGFMGVVLFASYMVYLLRLAYRNIGSHWGVALFSFILMSGVVMVTNNIFSGYQLMSLVIILNMACSVNERVNKSINMEAKH